MPPLRVCQLHEPIEAPLGSYGASCVQSNCRVSQDPCVLAVDRGRQDLPERLAKVLECALRRVVESRLPSRGGHARWQWQANV